MGWLKRTLYFVVFLAFIATFYSLTSIRRQNNVIKTPEVVEQTTKDVETREEEVKKKTATPAIDRNTKTPPTKSSSSSSSKFRKIEGYMDVNSGEVLALDCGSCAFVGSSGHILNSAAGTEIDSHDCVFRMNGAIVRGFEKDVGRRTTVRIVNHSGGVVFNPRGRRSKYFEEEKSDHLVVWGPPQKTPILKPMLVDLVKHYPYLKAFTMTKEKIIALDKQFERETGKDRFKSSSWLTTGWFAFDIVLKACRDNVVVYGLPPGNYCDSAEGAKTFIRYHYYEEGGSECSYYKGHTHHRFAAEKIIYARWAKTRGNVSFRFPSWNLTQIDTSQVKF